MTASLKSDDASLFVDPAATTTSSLVEWFESPPAWRRANPNKAMILAMGVGAVLGAIAVLAVERLRDRD